MATKLKPRQVRKLNRTLGKTIKSMFTDEERVALFVSRCADVFKVDVDSIRAKPNLSKNDWRKLHSSLLRKRALPALAKLGIQGDASEWKSLEENYGPLMIMSTAGRGRPPSTLPDGNDLEAELKRLGGDKFATGKLAKKHGVTPAAVRARRKKKGK